MTIHFHSIDIFDDDGSAAGSEFLKAWNGWTGPEPQQGDIVILHWGPNNEESDPWKVVGRRIDGTRKDHLDIFCTKVML